MIPFDFIYCRPNSLTEASDIFNQLQHEGKNPVYYAGGSEIITMCRAGSIQPKAVIDLKNIPECTLLYRDDSGLHAGAACTLNQIKESGQFPLLDLVMGRIADHTNQCRITLGGNLCGSIRYRETSLPLLLSDAEITLFGMDGSHTAALESVFQEGQLQLSPGEFVVGIHAPEWALEAPHFHVKRTRNEKIDYPLVSAASLWKGEDMRIAFSGICAYPFRSRPMEALLNNKALSMEERADSAAAMLPELAYGDAEASGEYRMFVFKNTLLAFLEEWENGKI